MTEAELYKELGALTKEKDRWAESIPYVSSLLTHESVKIQAKAIWLLGEMGLLYPQSVQDVVPTIASFLDSICCIIKIPKVADKNGESCISILEKIA